MSTQDIIETKNKKLQAIFSLVIAEATVGEIEDDREGYSLAKNALRLCWKWVKGENISGDTLAEYVDGPTEKDLGMREGQYNGNQDMISALVAVTLTIGLVSRFAYELQGKVNMPTPIWEIDEESLYHIVQFASNAKSFNNQKINSVVNTLKNDFDDAAINANLEKVRRYMQDI